MAIRTYNGFRVAKLSERAYQLVRPSDRLDTNYYYYNDNGACFSNRQKPETEIDPQLKAAILKAVNSYETDFKIYDDVVMTGFGNKQIKTYIQQTRKNRTEVRVKDIEGWIPANTLKRDWNK
jgi:hypothetical protein